MFNFLKIISRYEYYNYINRGMSKDFVFTPKEKGLDLKKLDNMLDEALEKETKESLNKWLSEKDAKDTVIQEKKDEHT